jgi:hypothetical protein
MEAKVMPAKQKLPEKIFTIWALLALATLIPVTQLLHGSFPIFTVVWILVPLFFVLKTKDASRVGWRMGGFTDEEHLAESDFGHNVQSYFGGADCVDVNP